MKLHGLMKVYKVINLLFHLQTLGRELKWFNLDLSVLSASIWKFEWQKNDRSGLSITWRVTEDPKSLDFQALEIYRNARLDPQMQIKISIHSMSLKGFKKQKKPKITEWLLISFLWAICTFNKISFYFGNLNHYWQFSGSKTGYLTKECGTLFIWKRSSFLDVSEANAKGISIALPHSLQSAKYDLDLCRQQ